MDAGSTTSGKEEITFSLQALRLSLMEAQRRTSPPRSIVDRITATLLAGLAVESALAISLGRDIRDFDRACNDLETSFGPLAFRRDGARAWRARTGLQHLDLLPDEESCRDVVASATNFSREVLHRTRHIDLDGMSGASTSRVPALGKAYADLEEVMQEGDIDTAAIWIARILACMEQLVSSIESFTTSGSLDHRLALSDFHEFRLIRDALDYVSENEIFRECFGLGRVDRARLRRSTPYRVHVAWGRATRGEVIQRIRLAGRPIDEDEVRWAASRLAEAILHFESVPIEIAGDLPTSSPTPNSHSAAPARNSEEDGGTSPHA